jgi:hypothetical protein
VAKPKRLPAFSFHPDEIDKAGAGKSVFLGQLIPRPVLPNGNLSRKLQVKNVD